MSVEKIDARAALQEVAKSSRAHAEVLRSAANVMEMQAAALTLLAGEVEDTSGKADAAAATSGKTSKAATTKAAKTTETKLDYEKDVKPGLVDLRSKLGKAGDAALMEILAAIDGKKFDANLSQDQLAKAKAMVEAKLAGGAAIDPLADL